MSATPEIKPPEGKSYLVETLSAFSPWGSRAATPKPPVEALGDDSSASSAAQRGGDHSLRSRQRLKLKDYPKDCPKLMVQWYHAVDVCLSHT